MVTILPEEKNGWGDIGHKFGSGVAQGYANRADETAIQKAITALGPNAGGREIIDALTKTRTYNPESKQTFLKNLMGAEKIDAMKEEAQQERLRNQQKQTLDQAKFEEDKRATGKAESQKDRALDIAADKAVATKKIDNAASKAASQVSTIQGALTTVAKMRELGEKGGLGLGTGVRQIFDEGAAERASEYERLGKSLIALSTTIPIRNQREFEVLSHDLFDPSIRDAKREGILKAMEKILTDSMTSVQAGLGQEISNITTGKKQYFSKSNGRPLKDLPEEQIKELMEKGLITDVKPE